MRSTSPSPRREGYEAVGVELSLGTQASDRMIGEPTTFPKAWFDASAAQDATPLLNEARMIKTPQELERMQLANDIAAAAMEHVQGVIRPGMTRRQAAAEWLGFVHGEGTGWAGKVDLAYGFLSSGRGRHQDVHARPLRARRRGRADAVRDLGLRRRLLGRPPKNLVVGELSERYRELEQGLMGVYDDAMAFCAPGASLPELDRRVRAGIDGDRLPRAAVATRSATASALAPTSRRTHTRPEAARFARAWFLRSSRML